MTDGKFALEQCQQQAVIDGNLITKLTAERDALARWKNVRAAEIEYDQRRVFAAESRATAAEATVTALQKKLETANALVTCCCGSPVDAHGMGDGHSPVDMYHYDMMQREARIADLEGRLAKAAEALEAAADQLARAHDDAFKQCAGYGLITSDGRDFSCLQLNKCGEQASRARTALSQIRSEK